MINFVIKLYKFSFYMITKIYQNLFNKYFKFLLLISCIYNIGFPGGVVFNLFKEIKDYSNRSYFLSEKEELLIYMESFNQDLKRNKINIQTIRDKMQQALQEKKEAKLYILEKKITEI